MGQDQFGRGWRSQVAPDSIMGDLFADVDADAAAQRVDCDSLTPAQRRDLQKRHCRDAGRHAGRDKRACSNQSGAGHAANAHEQFGNIEGQINRWGRVVAKANGILSAEFDLELNDGTFRVRAYEDFEAAHGRLVPLEKTAVQLLEARIAQEQAREPVNVPKRGEGRNTALAEAKKREEALVKLQEAFSGVLQAHQSRTRLLTRWRAVADVHASPDVLRDIRRVGEIISSAFAPAAS